MSMFLYVRSSHAIRSLVMAVATHWRQTFVEIDNALTHQTRPIVIHLFSLPPSSSRTPLYISIQQQCSQYNIHNINQQVRQIYQFVVGQSLRAPFDYEAVNHGSQTAIEQQQSAAVASNKIETQKYFFLLFLNIKHGPFDVVGEPVWHFETQFPSDKVENCIRR